MTVQTYSLPRVTIEAGTVCRYLGARAGALPPELLGQIETICARAETLGVWRAGWLTLPIRVEEACVDAGGLIRLPGKSLAAHLAGCARAVLFCATAGPGFDRMLSANRLQPARLAIWDAAGTAGIESFCDRFCEALGGHQRSRFSPGYGDSPLEMQEQLLEFLDAEKQLGITLSKGYMMSPSKSITAIIGLADHPVTGRLATCDECVLKDKCQLRKEGKFCGQMK